MPEFPVDLSAGGTLYLWSEEEVERWNLLNQRYREDFGIEKMSDLAALDMLVQQHINAYRAQVEMSGMVAEFDSEGLATGRRVRKELKVAEKGRAQEDLNSAAKEIARIEKQLGIDKTSRDAGGKHEVDEYLTNLKRAGREYGVHIANRVKRYEQFAMDLRFRLRINANADDEDKRYIPSGEKHDNTDAGVLAWAREHLADLEEADKQFAHEKGRLWLGKL